MDKMTEAMIEIFKEPLMAALSDVLKEQMEDAVLALQETPAILPNSILTTHKVAKILGVSHATVLTYIKDDGLNCAEIRSKKFVIGEDLMAWMKDHMIVTKGTRKVLVKKQDLTPIDISPVNMSKGMASMQKFLKERKQCQV